MNSINIIISEEKPCDRCGKSIRVCFIPHTNRTWVVDSTFSRVLNSHECSGENRALHPYLLIDCRRKCNTCGESVRPVFVVQKGIYRLINDPAGENDDVTFHSCPTYSYKSNH